MILEYDNIVLVDSSFWEVGNLNWEEGNWAWQEGNWAWEEGNWAWEDREVGMEVELDKLVGMQELDLTA